MDTLLDRLPVSQLKERYNIERSTVYSRFKTLNIKPERTLDNSYVSAEQLELLDKFNNHLKNGGTVADFFGSSPTTESTAQNLAKSEAFNEALAVIARAFQPLIVQLTPAVDPFANYDLLAKAAHKGYHLPTSTLLPLLGLKSVPKLQDGAFRRRGFVFERMEKTGRESDWSVKRCE